MARTPFPPHRPQKGPHQGMATGTLTVKASDPLKAALDALDWVLLERLCRNALSRNPEHLQANRLLGFALQKQHKNDEALRAYQEGTKQQPKDAELIVNHANFLLELGRSDLAFALLETTTELRPDHPMIWLKLAQSCYLIGLHQRGLEAAQKALELIDDDKALKCSALNQSAIHRRELGQVREAVQNCKEAITLSPTDPSSYVNGMLFMLADPGRNIKDIKSLADQFAEQFEAPHREKWPKFEDTNRQPWRRLKIGFISPDLRNHAVMYFVEGLLAQLDRRMFEVYAFYMFPVEDYVTERVHNHVDHFIKVEKELPIQQALLIRSYGIDITIDLAGHTGYSGILALAHKPAPIQISWLGFPATTGLQAVDYKITDDVTDPQGAEDQYSEKLYRLPTFFCCYRPMIRAPLYRYQPRYVVKETPALKNGYITFGTCNNLGKITDEVLSLWGAILQAVPNSRLLIEGKNLGLPDIEKSYRARCERLGVDAERLILKPLNPANQYLTYHEIDIALDPFPLVGGTTSCDVLWMGVPLVSMEGDSFKSRMGQGILTHLGRTEWLAHSAQEYLDIACRLAQDIEALNTTRLGMRREVEQSVIMREDIYTQHFGEALRAMWLEWLAKTQYPDDQAAQQKAMQEWMEQSPPEWHTPPVPGVGVAPGERLTLHEAHARILGMVDNAKAKGIKEGITQGRTIIDPDWEKITELAEHILCAVPNDPVALSCLAEVEMAHGHQDFAMTYLRYAMQAMGQ